MVKFNAVRIKDAILKKNGGLGMKRRKYFCDWLDKNQSWLSISILSISLIISTGILMSMDKQLEKFIIAATVCVVVTVIIWLIAMSILNYAYEKSRDRKNKEKIKRDN